MWLARREYRSLLKQIARAERRALSAESALELERHENRLSERHWSNQLLRKVNAYPQPDAKAEKPKPLAVFTPTIDPSELAALQTEAIRLGLNPKEAENVLRQEKGLPLV
jgi:hypothetical protein